MASLRNGDIPLFCSEVVKLHLYPKLFLKNWNLFFFSNELTPFKKLIDSFLDIFLRVRYFVTSRNNKFVHNLCIKKFSFIMELANGIKEVLQRLLRIITNE
jgi:hypothetical protein